MPCQATINVEDSPILDACFGESSYHDDAGPDSLPPVYTGSLDGNLFEVSVSDGKKKLIGSHEPSTSNSNSNSISCVGYAGSGIVITAGWDHKLKIWDMQNPQSQPQTFPLPGKAFSMSVSVATGQILVGTSGRRLVIFRVGRAGSGSGSTPSCEQMQDRESTLKYQTRVVRWLGDGGGECCERA